jgi:hypothetical protein
MIGEGEVKSIRPPKSLLKRGHDYAIGHVPGNSLPAIDYLWFPHPELTDAAIMP